MKHRNMMLVLLVAFLVAATVPGQAERREMWTARYDGPNGYDDKPAAMAVTPNGGTLFVTGSSEVGYDDYATAALHAHGTCESGASEQGRVSELVHDEIEPLAGPARRGLHQLSCTFAAKGV